MTEINNLSDDEVELELIVELSCREWHDLTKACPDPDAVKCYGMGWNGKRRPNTIFLLCQYADGEVVLISTFEGRDEWKKVTAEAYKAEWLWEKVAALR